MPGSGSTWAVPPLTSTTVPSPHRLPLLALGRFTLIWRTVSPPSSLGARAVAPGVALGFASRATPFPGFAFLAGCSPLAATGLGFHPPPGEGRERSPSFAARVAARRRFPELLAVWFALLSPCRASFRTPPLGFPAPPRVVPAAFPPAHTALLFLTPPPALLVARLRLASPAPSVAALAFAPGAVRSRLLGAALRPPAAAPLPSFFSSPPSFSSAFTTAFALAPSLPSAFPSTAAFALAGFALHLPALPGHVPGSVVARFVSRASLGVPPASFGFSAHRSLSWDGRRTCRPFSGERGEVHCYTDRDDVYDTVIVVPWGRDRGSRN